MGFDWPSIGTHAIELLIGAVSTWLFGRVNSAHKKTARLKRDLDAAFMKIRAIEFEREHEKDER